MDIVAAPVFPGQHGPVYHSVLVASAVERHRATLEDLPGSVLAVNEPGSWSGHHALRAMLVERGVREPVFRHVVVTGSHAASIRALLTGAASVAAIDHTVWEDAVASTSPTSRRCGSSGARAKRRRRRSRSRARSIGAWPGRCVKRSSTWCRPGSTGSSRPRSATTSRFVSGTRRHARSLGDSPMAVTVSPSAIDFLHDTTWDDLPPAVRHATARCLVDLCGSIVAGRRTRLSAIVRDYAVAAHGGDQATLLLDGRRVSAPGAALATGMTIDSFDIHDSHRESLGHAGVHVIAAILATAELRASRGTALPSGQELLTAMAVGYELGCRAGEALHGTVADYHTSGAWGAVSSAGLYARLMGLDADAHARGARDRRVPRAAQPDDALHRPPDDGQGRFRLGRDDRRQRRDARRSRVHRRALRSPWSRPPRRVWWADARVRVDGPGAGFKAHGSCWWSQPAIEAVLALARAHGFGAG